MLTSNTEHQRKEYEGRSMEISKVTQYKNQGQLPFNIENQSISSIDSSPKADSNRKIKKLKKQSLQSDSPLRPSLQISDKYRTANVIVQREDDSHVSGEDVYLQMSKPYLIQLGNSTNSCLKLKFEEDSFSKYLKFRHLAD